MFSEQTKEDFEARGLGRFSLMGFVKAVFLYPAFMTPWLWGVSIALFDQGGPWRVLARLIRARGIKRGGCDLSPRAQIGRRLKMPHPVAIVVGEYAQIGDDVTLYHNVTIGQRGDFEKMPVLKDGVVVYAGACILGDITIGENAVIAANAVVMENVAANTVVAGTPAKPIKSTLSAVNQA